MIIFSLIFFGWIIVFLIMGGFVAWSERRKRGQLGAKARSWRNRQ